MPPQSIFVSVFDSVNRGNASADRTSPAPTHTTINIPLRDLFVFKKYNCIGHRHWRADGPFTSPQAHLVFLQSKCTDSLTLQINIFFKKSYKLKSPNSGENTIPSASVWSYTVFFLWRHFVQLSHPSDVCLRVQTSLFKSQLGNVEC